MDYGVALFILVFAAGGFVCFLHDHRRKPSGIKAKIHHQKAAYCWYCGGRTGGVGSHRIVSKAKDPANDDAMYFDADCWYLRFGDIIQMVVDAVEEGRKEGTEFVVYVDGHPAQAWLRRVEDKGWKMPQVSIPAPKTSPGKKEKEKEPVKEEPKPLKFKPTLRGFDVNLSPDEQARMSDDTLIDALKQSGFLGAGVKIRRG